MGASDWREYGWDNAFDAEGRWTRGPLHGYVYFMKNIGSADRPRYAGPLQIQAGGSPVDVYGAPSPNFADWDSDGDLDLICAEFIDGFTYFRNDGTRTQPRYSPGRRLRNAMGEIKMDLEMLRAVAIDWDGDDDVDLIVGQEDGRVALLEFTGRSVDGMPEFLAPRFFRAEAKYVKCGVLPTPSNVDWDGDGDDDLICGDTAGYVSFIENLDGGNPPSFAPRASSAPAARLSGSRRGRMARSKARPRRSGGTRF